MDTLASTSTVRGTSIRIATAHPTEFIDLTHRLEAIVADARIRTGLITVQTLHTTTAIVVNEHEPWLLADFAALLQRIAPVDGEYQHDGAPARTAQPTAGERINGHAHCRALLLPSSAGLTIAGGRLHLGRWQRVFLVELDGPQEREVSVVVVGESGR